MARNVKITRITLTHFDYELAEPSVHSGKKTRALWLYK